jgi:threonylcarbamoyladenosine tRNA methylthiotransferase MtaB
MNFSVLTFGCRANQADSCEIERGLRAKGGLPSAAETADLVVVNTCTVTAAADQAARHAIRRVARLNPSARIIATGCYATRIPGEVRQLPGVLALVPNSAKSDLLGSVGPEFDSQVRRLAPSPFETLGATPSRVKAAHVLGLSPGSRGRTAYPVRVQTGCDERCAYCIVPSTRGAATSRLPESVVDEARMAADAGFKELWITGVHLGSYGRDLSPATSLLGLLAALVGAAEGTDLTFRLSSLEPMDCGDDLLDAIVASPRVLPHLHLPLQHASDRMLAAMRRPYSLSRFQAAADGIRRRLPEAAIGTDVIVGFPGETDDDFERMAVYLCQSPLTHVHVFPYSDRPGTEASEMPDKVAAAVVRRRAEHLRGIARALGAAFAERQVGQERPALTLHDGTTALTDNYLKVKIPAGLGRNQRVRVRVASANPLRGDAAA